MALTSGGWHVSPCCGWRRSGIEICWTPSDPQTRALTRAEDMNASLLNRLVTGLAVFPVKGRPCSAVVEVQRPSHHDLSYALD